MLLTPSRNARFHVPQLVYPSLLNIAPIVTHHKSLHSSRRLYNTPLKSTCINRVRTTITVGPTNVRFAYKYSMLALQIRAESLGARTWLWRQYRCALFGANEWSVNTRLVMRPLHRTPMLKTTALLI